MVVLHCPGAVEYCSREVPLCMQHSVTVPALLLSAGGAARALQMSVSVGKTNLLLRNLLRTPILELEASKLNLGKRALLSCRSGGMVFLGHMKDAAPHLKCIPSLVLPLIG